MSSVWYRTNINSTCNSFIGNHFVELIRKFCSYICCRVAIFGWVKTKTRWEMTVDIQVCLLCQKDRKKLGKQDSSGNSAVRGGSSPNPSIIQIPLFPRILTTFDQVQDTLCVPVTQLKKYSVKKKKEKGKSDLDILPNSQSLLEAFNRPLWVRQGQRHLSFHLYQDD